MRHSYFRKPLRRDRHTRLHLNTLEDRITPTAPIPVGTEIPVNTYTAGSQMGGSVGTDAAGNYVVVWDGQGPDDSQGVFAQRFSAAGVPQGAQFRVNSTTAGNQISPSVDMKEGGGFVVVWEGPDGSNYDVFAQQFDAIGVPQGGELRVNNATYVNTGLRAKLAFDTAGNFVVTWNPGNASAVLAQRFDADGVPQGGQIQVNSVTLWEQNDPSIAMTPNGDFWITWEAAVQGSNFNIYARQFDVNGQPYAPEFQVNTPLSGYQGSLEPTVATDSQGNFTAVWSTRISFDTEVFCRRFNSVGLPLGDQFQVNTIASGFRNYQTIAMRPEGDFVVTWESNQTNSMDVYARAFDAAGNARGDEFRVNTHTAGDQERPDIAINGSGNLVIAWDDSSGQDGDGTGIFAQRYRPGVAQVQSTRVNDGSAQRSRVTSLTVTFDSQVTFAGPVGDSFTLVRNGGEPVSFTAMASVVNGVTAVTLSNFTGTSTEFGSLTDGRYTLTVLASQITDDFGQHLDGDGNLQEGGNYAFGDAQGLFRFFGDVNGDQIVNGLDFGFFKNAFGTQVGDANYLSYLDLNGDGVINGFDFGQFRTRFGTMLP